MGGVQNSEILDQLQLQSKQEKGAEHKYFESVGCGLIYLMARVLV